MSDRASFSDHFSSLRSGGAGLISTVFWSVWFWAWGRPPKGTGQETEG